MGKVKPLRKNHVIVIKTVNPDMTSHGGFRWKKRGFVKCDDWIPNKTCRNGLFGLLRGIGDGTFLDWGTDAVWLCLSVNRYKVIKLFNKVKFPECWVLKAGKREEVLKYAEKHGVDLLKCAGGWSIKSGYRSFSICAGDGSNSSSYGVKSGSSSDGYKSRSISVGDESSSNSDGLDSRSSSAGCYSSSSSAGGRSKSVSFGFESRSASAGFKNKTTAIGFRSSSSSAGSKSNSNSFGSESTSSSSGIGSCSTSNGNNSRSSSAGDGCVSISKGRRTISMIAGLNGKASAGPDGVFALPWIDKDGNLHIAVGEVGKNRIMPNVLYKVDDNGNLLKTSQEDKKANK